MPFGYALFFGFVAAVHAHILVAVWLDIFGVLRRINRKLTYYSVPILCAVITVFLVFTSENFAIIAFIFYATVTIITNVVDYIRKRKR